MKARTLAMMAAAGFGCTTLLSQTAPAAFVGLESEWSFPSDVAVCRIYAVFDNPGDRILTIGDTSNTPTVEVIGGTFYQNLEGADDEDPNAGDTAPKQEFVDLFPSLAYDTFVTIGLDVVPYGVTDGTTLSPGWPGFGANIFPVDWPHDILWFIHDSPWGQGRPDADGRVLIGQFSSRDLDLCRGLSVGFRGEFAMQAITDDNPSLQAQLAFNYPMPCQDDGYPSWDELLTFLHDLGDSPAAALLSIGTAYEGFRDVLALRVGDPTKRPVVFTGGQHANEALSAMMVIGIALDLVDGRPDVAHFLDEYVFYLIPVVNPDGYAYARQYPCGDCRKNRRPNDGSGCIGVDLDRNWDAFWGGPGSSPDPCSEAYHGLWLFSESETQAVAQFVAGLTDVAAHVDVHSHAASDFYGGWVLYPFAGTQIPPASAALFDELASTMAQAVNAGCTYDSGQWSHRMYEAGGLMIDWAYLMRGLTSLWLDVCESATDWRADYEDVRPAWVSLLSRLSAIDCTGDFDGSGIVDTVDLLELLSSWGACPGCSADINGDGVVDTVDLLAMLSNWGACPQ